MTLDRRTFLGFAGAAGIGLFLLPRLGKASVPEHFPVAHSAAEWRRLLDPERYAVLREGATERAFTSPLLKEHRRGIFACAGCSNPLFSSATKFESGTGWPSFWKVLPGKTITRPDHKFLEERTEVICSRCGGHLGHVFNDGPKPTGLRYCMNGLALNFHLA